METVAKLDSSNQYQLLIIDGHSSHESLSTIRFCQDKKIVLYILPSHCTHALQLLDVVLFSPLKQAWSQAILGEEFSGWKVTKENFLQIYGTAHLQAFTEKNILKSFKKTGIWPLNPSVITPKMMAPSTITSLDAAAAIPFPLSSPIKKGMSFIRNLCQNTKRSRTDQQDRLDSPSDMFPTGISMPSEPPTTPPSCHFHPYLAPELHSPPLSPNIPDVFSESLSHSSMSILLSPSHIPAQSTLPPLIYQKCAQFSNIVTPITDSPSPLQGEFHDRLSAENLGLREEVTHLDTALCELHDVMQQGFDAGNTQIMLLASYLEWFLEQNTEKDRNCKKNRHCICGGKAVILTEEEIADLIDQAEAT